MCERKYRGDAGGSGFFPFPLFYFIFLTQLGLGRVFYTLKRDQLFFSWRFFIWEVITRCVPRKTNLLNWFNIYTSKSLADCLNTDHPPPPPPSHPSSLPRTGNANWTYIRRPGRLLNFLCTSIFLLGLGGSWFRSSFKRLNLYTNKINFFKQYDFKIF